MRVEADEDARMASRIHSHQECYVQPSMQDKGGLTDDGLPLSCWFEVHAKSAVVFPPQE